MPIKDRNLKVGTKLVARYKGKDYVCQVIDSPEGIRYQVLDQGKTSIHKTPSGAGSYVRSGKATNGWDFWSLEGQEPAPKAKAKEAEAAGFRRIPGGRAWCNGCAAAFKVKAGTTPPTCPEGHTP